MAAGDLMYPTALPIVRVGTAQRRVQMMARVWPGALNKAMDEGHCGLPVDELVPLAEELVEVSKELVRTALDLELAESAVIADSVGETPCVFLAGLHRLMRLVNGALPWPSIDADKAIPWIEQRTGLELADSQNAAIRLALASKALVITSGPGVGKTTIVNAFLRILAAKGTKLLPVRPHGPRRQAHDASDGF